MSTTLTRDQVRAAVEITRAVADCIHELGTVPSGHLYARLMRHLSLEQFEQIISVLVHANLVRRHPSHLLEWIGSEAGRPSHTTNNPQTRENTMSIDIPDNAKEKSIREKCQPPKGATHFRFTVKGRKPIIDSIKNLDTLAGCEGNIEFGKATYQGRGRNAKIVGFAVIGEKKPEEVKPGAEPKAAKEKAATSGAGSKGRKALILGHSACAIAKALGRAGVRYPEADAIMKKHGIEMPKASLSVQLGFGRRPDLYEKRGQPADISDAQIAELRKAAA